MVNIALQADSGQWLDRERQILLSTKRTWNKEGVAWSQRWLPYHLPEGYLGWPACKNRDRMRAIKPRGIHQDIDAVREHTLISRMHLNSNIQLSWSQLLFKTFCASNSNQYYTHFFLSFLAVQHLSVWIFLFLFTNFRNKNWRVPFGTQRVEAKGMSKNEQRYWNESKGRRLPCKY